jgi:hypothetical protein
MRFILTSVFILFVNVFFGQTEPENINVERKGFMIGFGLGAGILELKTKGVHTNDFSMSLPNIKVGYSLSDKLALMFYLPGAAYKFNGLARGFEAFCFNAQFWAKERWWIMAGTGLTFDAQAFYTVKDPKTAEFYTGLPAIIFGTGYEIYRKKKFTVDLQYRFFYGQSKIGNNETRLGISNMFIIGMNWY